MKVELDEVVQYLKSTGHYGAAHELELLDSAFVWTARVNKTLNEPRFKQEYLGTFPSKDEILDVDCKDRSCGAVACPTCGPIRR